MPAVGLLSVELHLSGARSLKDKRMVLRSIKDRLRKLNVAFAELEHHDLHQRARLGVVSIATTRDGVDRSLEAVLNEIERRDPGIVSATKLEWLI
jgi:uncharacterized protein YlxP (DUF503 family)